MLNHYFVSTSKVSAIVLLLFIFVLVNHYVSGFRGQQIALHRKVNEATASVLHDLHEISRANDVMYTPYDVINEHVPCPSLCDCSYVQNRSLILIHCENRTTETSLPHEINVYLSSVASKVTELYIVFTPLTVVPEYVCQMTRLFRLGMVFNPFLTRLPDNCFTRLHELKYFTAVGNGLTSLQNGLFDNLTKLVAVYFLGNHISSLGEHLFDVTANLTKLMSVDVSFNNLTEVDTWPVQRAQMINNSVIDLNHNSISQFSNSLGWHFDCTSAPLFSQTIIDLSDNNITHLNDLFRGWNITGLYDSVLFLYRLKRWNVPIVWYRHDVRDELFYYALPLCRGIKRWCASDTAFNVKRSKVNLQGAGHIVAASRTACYGLAALSMCPRFAAATHAWSRRCCSWLQYNGRTRGGLLSQIGISKYNHLEHGRLQVVHENLHWQ